ncbi:MAG: 50S ribosomal protein L21 [Actinomycetota bacterium]
MYAIIRTGGHQEKVVVGEQITVDRLKQEPGEPISFVPLMVGLDDGTIVTDHQQLTDKAAVTGRVLQHVKADKVEIFQYRQKTNYRRHTGHRQPMTLVEIAELRFGETVEKIDEKRAAEEAQKQALELTRQAEKEAEEDAPKKVTPKKKPAAKASGPKAGQASSTKKKGARKTSGKDG